MTIDAETAAPFYPPWVRGPAKPYNVAQYFLHFVDNPLSVMPQPVYHELIYQVGRRITYVCDPALVKRILLDDRDDFPKSPMERQVFGAMLGNGLLTAEDPDWRWQRQTAAPQFRHADILNYVPSMAAAALEQVNVWRADASNRPRSIDTDMSRITFRVIAETMLRSDDKAVTLALERSNSDYLLPISWPLAYGVVGLPTDLPFPGRARRRDAACNMREAVGDLVAERRRRPPAERDFCSRLLAAKDPETGDAMQDSQLVDNLLTFLLAGHETTAKALCWALYLLARQPEWEARLLDEVRRVAGDGPIDGGHIEHLVATTKFLKETMRLYPPIPSVGRVARKDVDLGGTRIAAGGFVLIPMYAIHRHHRLWDDPDRFDPERFSVEEEARRPRYHYMPFGAGPRVCIGASFSMVEAAVMLATFVRAARFEVPAGYVPVPLSRITLQPKGGMPLMVRMRESRRTR